MSKLNVTTKNYKGAINDLDGFFPMDSGDFAGSETISCPTFNCYFDTLISTSTAVEEHPLTIRSEADSDK